jgi:hypothetical protein
MLTRSCLVVLTGLSPYRHGIGFATGVVSERVRFDRHRGAALRRYGIAPVPHGNRAASGECEAVTETNPIARALVRVAHPLTQPAPRPSCTRAETQGADVVDRRGAYRDLHGLRRRVPHSPVGSPWRVAVWLVKAECERSGPWV